MNSNRKKRIFWILAALLILAAAIAVVGAILVRQCLSFDETGAHVIDRYGILAAEQAAQAEPEPQQQTEMQGSSEPEPEPKVYTRAAVLPADVLTDTDKRTQIISLVQAGVLNTVIVDVKSPDGDINVFVSEDNPAQADTDGFAEAVSELRNAGAYVIGRMYCLHDELAVDQDSDLAMQYDNGGIWTDYDRTHWLDPTNYGTVQYLSNIAQAAVQAGCNEIVLADFTFPPRGHLDRIEFDRDPDSQAGILAEAFQEIQDACQGVPISLTADSVSSLTELSVNGVEDGIPLGDITAFLGMANRLLVPTNEEEDPAGVIAEAHETVPNAWIVPIVDDINTWLEYDGDAILDTDEDGIAEAIEAIE